MVKDMVQNYSSSEVQRGKNYINWLLLVVVEDLKMLGPLRGEGPAYYKTCFQIIL